MSIRRVFSSWLGMVVLGFATTAFTARAAEDPESKSGEAVAESSIDPVPEAASACPRPAADDCYTYCTAGPEGRFWARADYLAFWTKGMRVPPLAMLTEPTVEMLLGDQKVNNAIRPGFEVTLGGWLDCEHKWGIEGNYFDIGEQSHGYSTGFTDGDMVVIRPFINVSSGQPVFDGELVATPGIIAGMVTADVSTYFQSAGLRLRRNLWCENWCSPCGDTCDSGCETRTCGRIGAAQSTARDGFRLDGIMGYRFSRLKDRLDIHETDVALGGAFPNGTGIDINDNFHSGNTFNGGDFGLIATVYKGRWSFETQAKLAMGCNRETVNIFGRTAWLFPDSTQPDVYSGGLLALDTNIGDYARNRFAMMPEFNVEVGYQLTSCLRTFVGYDIMYWNRVVRAGDQIDVGIDPANLPPVIPGGVQRPAFAWQESAFWAQGFRVGAEVRF